MNIFIVLFLIIIFMFFIILNYEESVLLIDKKFKF